MSAFAEPPVYNILTAAPLLIWLAVVDPGLQHTVESADIRLLIFGVPGKFPAHLLGSGQRTTDAANPRIPFIVKKITSGGSTVVRL